MFDDCVCYLTSHDYPSSVEGKSHGILLYQYKNHSRKPPSEINKCVHERPCSVSQSTNMLN